MEKVMMISGREWGEKVGGNKIREVMGWDHEGLCEWNGKPQKVN